MRKIKTKCYTDVVLTILKIKALTTKGKRKKTIQKNIFPLTENKKSVIR